MLKLGIWCLSHDLYIFRRPLAHILRGLSSQIVNQLPHFLIQIHLLIHSSTPIIFQLQLDFLAPTWLLYSSAAWVSQPPRSEQSKGRRRNASRSMSKTSIFLRNKMQTESDNSPTKESTKDQWTAELCMAMVSPTAVQKCNSSTREPALLRSPPHKAHQSTTISLPKKQHQDIPDDGIRDDFEPRISLSPTTIKHDESRTRI